MTITASQVMEDSIQGSRRRVRYQYTNHVGKVVERMKFIAIGVDANVDMATYIPILEASQKIKELPKLLQRIENGENPLSITPDHNTTDEYYTYLLKKMANAESETAIKYAQMDGLFTDAQISTLLGITSQEAADWRVKVKDLATAATTMDGYSSGMSFEVEL